MKISVFAVAALTVPLARGQMRGGAMQRHLNAEEGTKPEEKSIEKTVDFLPIYKAVESIRSKTAVDVTESSVKPSQLFSSNDEEEKEAPVCKISGPYKYESSKWKSRGIEGQVHLDVDAFDAAVIAWSKALCDLGVTATLFDNSSKLVYQKSVGTMYTPFVEGGYSMSSGFGPLQEGWTGDTVYTPYSNSKGVAAATYLASVVDTGLGYLDEPISNTFTELKDSQVGQITPRQILSHTSGLVSFNREDPENDLYYSCKYDESKTLRECLETVVLTDDNLANPPGAMVGYNNEPFDILAVLAVEKTGMNNYGEIFQKYITDPLGMDSTTYNCPVLKSTQEKPNVAWGLCSTGNDFPKFVQMLSLDGMSPSEERVLTKNAVYQMFSHGGGTAQNCGDLLWGGQLPMYVTRCYPRLVPGILKDVIPEFGDLALPLTSVSGYGLGTKFFLGNYGEIFGHGGSTGGIWMVAPGRFAAYLTWMASGVVAPAEAGLSYPFIADILNELENASTFSVKNSLDVGKDDAAEEIEVCGGPSMYDDLFSELGISSMKVLFPPPQCAGEQRLPTEVNPLSAAMDFTGYPFHLL